MSRFRRGIAIALSLIVTLSVMTLSAGSPAAAEPKAGSNLQWRSCYRTLGELVWPEEFADQLGGPVRFECSHINVPLDYDANGGQGTVRIPLVRIPAQDQANKIGSLLTNPGGPSGSGIEFTIFSAPLAFGPEVRARFDIVGFDPRGVLFSKPARCFGTFKQAVAELFDGPATPRNPAQIEEWLANDAFLQAQCAKRGSRILNHMSTANVARDMDQIREAVGDEQLTYVGFSYGTYLGAVYANLFPDNIRAMALDSALDPVAWSTGSGDGDTVPVTTRIGSHIGAQATLEEFFRLCEESGPELCPIAPGAAERWMAVLDQLDESPVRIPFFDENGNLIDEFEYNAGFFIADTVGLLYDRFAWPIIAFITADIELLLSGEAPDGFAARFSRDLTALRAGEDNRWTAQLDRTRPPNYFNFLESFPAVLCSDSDNPDDIEAWVDAAAAAEEVSKFGGFWTWASSICNGWPAADEDRYTGPWDAQTSNTILILNNQFDPATPLEGAIALDNALANSALLVVEGGGGHIADIDASCASEAIDSYILTTEIPPLTGCVPDLINPFELFGPPELFLVELPDGSIVEAVIVETEDGPVALDPETGEPLNIDPDTGEILPIVIIEPVP